MFEGLKGMGALAGMMRDLPRLKAKMEEVRIRLGEVRVEAESGGGAVRVVASGHLRVISMDVDHVLLAGLVDTGDLADRELAAELIASAVNAALEKAREAAEIELRSAAGEVGLPLPPGGLPGLF